MANKAEAGGPAMTQAELETFLHTQRTLVLATTRKSGSPVMHALWFAYRDGAVFINIQTGSFKHRNIERDPRVCCLIEDGESFFELRGAMIEGRATPVTDPAERERALAAMEEKNRRIGDGTAELPEHFRDSRAQRLERGDRLIIRIPLERVRSWNFGKARGHYQATDSD